MLKLSIVIPAYNVEKYIANCIESCLRQDIPQNEYELVVINDGSSDGTMQIAQAYAAKYGNLRIVEQENAGLSVARNAGTAQARGEYIWFVDSDDTIKANVLGFLTKTAIDDHLDILCFDISPIAKGASAGIFPGQPEQSGRIFSGTDFITKVDMPPSACTALYRTEFLKAHSLKFTPGLLHEDFEFTPRAYCLAQRISYVNVCAYYYLVREESIMTAQSKRRQKASDMLRICDALYNFAKQHLAEGSEAHKAMTRKINFAFSQSLRNYSPDVFSLDEYRRKPYYPLDVSVEGERKWRLKYRLANLSLPLYLLVHKWVKR